VLGLGVRGMWLRLSHVVFSVHFLPNFVQHKHAVDSHIFLRGMWLRLSHVFFSVHFLPNFVQHKHAVDSHIFVQEVDGVI
jgi:hypothetical protein